MNAYTLRRVHLVLLVVWMVVLPVSIATGWIMSVAFVSACSIYANAAAHWAAWQGSRPKRKRTAMPDHTSRRGGFCLSAVRATGRPSRRR